VVIVEAHLDIFKQYPILIGIVYARLGAEGEKVCLLA
jgi:hypothetical protein